LPFFQNALDIPEESLDSFQESSNQDSVFYNTEKKRKNVVPYRRIVFEGPDYEDVASLDSKNRQSYHRPLSHSYGIERPTCKWCFYSDFSSQLSDKLNFFGVFKNFFHTCFHPDCSSSTFKPTCLIIIVMIQCSIDSSDELLKVIIIMEVSAD